APLVGRELAGGRARAALGRCLLDGKVVVGEGGDLWQVGDAEHLTGAAERGELPPDDLRDRAADPGVDFVEDDGRRVSLFESYGLDRQHDARELPAGGEASEGARIFAWVGREVEFHGVLPPGGKRDRLRGESYLEAGVLHAERGELLDDP